MNRQFSYFQAHSITPEGEKVFYLEAMLPHGTQPGEWLRTTSQLQILCPSTRNKWVLISDLFAFAKLPKRMQPGNTVSVSQRPEGQAIVYCCQYEFLHPVPHTETTPRPRAFWRLLFKQINVSHYVQKSKTVTTG